MYRTQRTHPIRNSHPQFCQVDRGRSRTLTQTAHTPRLLFKRNGKATVSLEHKHPLIGSLGKVQISRHATSVHPLRKRKALGDSRELLRGSAFNSAPSTAFDFEIIILFSFPPQRPSISVILGLSGKSNGPIRDISSKPPIQVRGFCVRFGSSKATPSHGVWGGSVVVRSPQILSADDCVSSAAPTQCRLCVALVSSSRPPHFFLVHNHKSRLLDCALLFASPSHLQSMQ